MMSSTSQPATIQLRRPSDSNSLVKPKVYSIDQILGTQHIRRNNIGKYLYINSF